VRSTVEGNKESSHFLPLSLSSLRLGGIILPEKTAEGYKLRSRGLASQGFDVLDNQAILESHYIMYPLKTFFFNNLILA
jgi:hypothetical protein